MTVLGESPVENERVLRRMVLIREDQTYPEFKVRQALAAASWFYPQWSHELADEPYAGLDAVAVVVAIIGLARAWSSVDGFFSTLTIEGLTGMLAAVTVILLVSGLATARRVTV